MIRVEIAQASLPMEHIFFHTVASQWELVKDVFDGIEVHLTNSLATLQLAHMPLGDAANSIGGIHAPARGERLGINPKEWPTTPFALGYTLAMMHAVDSLGVVDRIAANVGSPDIPITLYPLENDEHLRVQRGRKLMQLKSEAVLRYDIGDPDRLHSFLLDHPEWNGYVHDIQHSSVIFPTKMIREIPGISRGHLSLDRKDLEPLDTPISSESIAMGTKDTIIYPWIMEMARLHNGFMTFVVETPPPLRNAEHWLSHNAHVVGNIRKWTD